MSKKGSLIIAIDFDGTLVEHQYPSIGEEVPRAFATLKALQIAGHKLILYTMRSGKPLDAAVAFCRSRGVTFWAVNANPEQKSWAPDARKVYANIYVDDAALGCPLVHMPDQRPYVNWGEVDRYFRAMKILE